MIANFVKKSYGSKRKVKVYQVIEIFFDTERRGPRTTGVDAVEPPRAAVLAQRALQRHQ